MAYLTAEQESHISTHTPLAGRDNIGVTTTQKMIHFYSHAPRGT